MTPLDLLLSALAFLGFVTALWLFVALTLFVITVTKPRGRSFTPRHGIDFVERPMQRKYVTQEMRDAYQDAVRVVRGD